jgi:hypothetical protein
MPTKLPIGITYRGVRSSKSLSERVQRMVESKLVPVCDHINRCDIAIERVVRRPHDSKSGYRVRLGITVPPSHRIVVTRMPQRGDDNEELLSTLQDAFRAAKRRLKKMSELQRRHVKSHPEQQVNGIVRKISGSQGEIETRLGETLPFHLNAVIGTDPLSLRPGNGVSFTTTDDELGWRATSVRVLDSRRSH